MGSGGSKDRRSDNSFHSSSSSNNRRPASSLKTTCIKIEDLEAPQENKKNINNNKSVGFTAADFKVVKLKVGIDKKPTTVDEKSAAVLKYRTPHFRALAGIEVPPLEEKQALQIGWIQTCSHMHFINRYGDLGLTSWEFPEIVSGKYSMVSDADGKQYPWYGSKHEVQTVEGPAQRQTLTVHMNDNFFPQVTWYVPHSSFDKKARLTYIYRKQKFYTYLVAKDVASDRYHVLKTITWSMELNIEVNPSLPLGRRAKLIGPLEQEVPAVIDDSHSTVIDKCALKPPNANNSQTLVWRSSSGSAKIVVPPLETTMDLEKYLLATKDLVKNLTNNIQLV